MSLFAMILLQAVALVVWATRIDTRVDVIERRGSPQISVIDDRLIRVEERQQNVLQVLIENTKRLDSIAIELRRHEDTTRGK